MHLFSDGTKSELFLLPNFLNFKLSMHCFIIREKIKQGGIIDYFPMRFYSFMGDSIFNSKSLILSPDYAEVLHEAPLLSWLCG